MQGDAEEELLLRSVALQNAKAVLLARERAERELIRTKEDLQKSSQRLVSILESIRDGFYTLDNDWRFTYLNRRGQEFFQSLDINRESVLGESIWELFPEALGTEIEQNFREAVKTQNTVEFETFYLPLDSWFVLRVYPAAEGLSVFFQDISNRKRSEELLRRSEQRFRATFNQAAVGMAIATLDGQIKEANARFAEILGYSIEELYQLDVTAITYTGDLKSTEDNLKKLVSGEIKSYVLEKRYIRKDGGIVWSLTSVTLLRDTEGKPEHFVGVIEDITKRKEAEEAVRQGVHRLQLALSAGQLGDWSWSVSTDQVTLGPEGARIFGVNTSSPLNASDLRKLVHEEDRDRARDAFSKALVTHSDYNMEYRVIRPDGWAWVASRGRGVYSDDGTVLGAHGVIQDITQRKQIQQIQARLAAVVESSDDAILSMDLDTKIATWNKGAEIMFGYSPKEIIGRSVTCLIPPGREDEEPRLLERLKKGERIEHYETIRVRKNGTLLDVSLTVSPIHDENLRIIGVSKISRDITERKRSEKALQEETRILELLNKTGTSIAGQLGLEALVQTVTDAATELSGAKFGAFFYNVTNAQGESFLLYTLSGADREDFEKFGQPRATPLFGPTFRGEGVVRCDDVLKDPRYGKMGPHHGMPKGHLPVRSYLAVPVISRSGEVLGGLFFAHPEPGIFNERTERIVLGVAAQGAIAIDNARLYEAAQKEITERKKVEEALRAAQEKLSSHAQELEIQVQERTAKLRETVGELEAFSYSVSHDMRSPLRAMQGYADALIDEYAETIDDTGKNYLNRIRRAALRMDLLIQDVLAYSKVAKGDIQLKRVDLEAVINDVIQHYPALQKGNAEITVKAPLPVVSGHEAYLTQIVSNLLSNSVKFVAGGTRPKITISASESDGYVNLVFEDNGIGIAPEHQKDIFQIFGRVYSDKKFEGTGIGLAIVKKAAERMGGAVSVTSDIGMGSKFTVQLKRR